MAINRELIEQKKVFSEYLRKKKLKITRQRQVILDTFLRTEGHMVTDELYQKVRKKEQDYWICNGFANHEGLDRRGSGTRDRPG